MRNRLEISTILTLAGFVMAQVGCEAPTPPDRKVYKPRIMRTPQEDTDDKPKHPAAIPLPAGAPVKIEIIKEGSGTVAEKNKKCTVHYVGWLSDGTEVDSSLARQPKDFVLGTGAVIKGWDQGILGMKVGGKRRLTIPPDLAYGSQGRGGIIPKNATLVFEIDLLEVSN